MRQCIACVSHDVVRFVFLWCSFAVKPKQTIAERVLALSELVGPSGYVFTTGGIGPTHDDMTYEAIASAFGVGLELHEPTRGALDKLMKKRGQELTPARLRMAMLPEGTRTPVSIERTCASTQAYFWMPDLRHVDRVCGTHQAETVGSPGQHWQRVHPARHSVVV